MVLDKKEMNNRLIEEWLKKYTSLGIEEMGILLDIKEMIKEDLTLFYEINKIIVQGQGQIIDEEVGIECICNGGNCGIQTKKGQLILDNDSFRKIIAAFIDVYEDIYPLGTVVDLKKKYFKNILPVDEVEHIRVVINYRFIPCSENMYIPYMGNVYPIGNAGVQTNGLHFSPKAIEKVVHMGYIDEEEIAFLFQRKFELILENNMHSSGFATKEEANLVEA